MTFDLVNSTVPVSAAAGAPPAGAAALEASDDTSTTSYSVATLCLRGLSGCPCRRKRLVAGSTNPHRPPPHTYMADAARAPLARTAPNKTLYY